ncbi:hypothetical protein EI94DRAFT_1790481 [Lactarius quietus]|nr:hypothetical protein EI94DRAFT_1790481 [Lactarius quietus]
MYMEMTTEEDKKIAEGWKADLTEFLSLTFIGGVLWVMSVTKPTGHRQLLFLKHLPEYCQPQYFEFPPFFPPSFSPPNYTVWVNALCITRALLATLSRQWARRYLWTPSHVTDHSSEPGSLYFHGTLISRFQVSAVVGRRLHGYPRMRYTCPALSSPQPLLITNVAHRYWNTNYLISGPSVVLYFSAPPLCSLRSLLVFKFSQIAYSRHSIPLDRAESQSQYDAVLSARSEAPIGALLG